MLVGVSQIDITPEPGVELQGFAVRKQPSDSIADRLYVRTLYLESSTTRFLWLVFDLIGFEVHWVLKLRQQVAEQFGFPVESVCCGVTHTHSGPGTSHLNCCGERDEIYLENLKTQVLDSVGKAVSSVEPVKVCFAEKQSDLGQDRGITGKRHTDNRIPVLGFRKENGEFVAVLLSFGMHPVLLNGTQISADWPGQVSRMVCDSLPGKPVTLVLSGACGNVNPPEVGVEYDTMLSYAENISQSVLANLEQSWTELGEQPLFQMVSEKIEFPVREYSAAQIEHLAEVQLNDIDAIQEFGQFYLDAVHEWKRRCMEKLTATSRPVLEIEVTLLRMDHCLFALINAEVFSHIFRLIVRDDIRFYVIGSTNGTLGYIPDQSAYEVNSYENLWSSFFYNSPVIRIGTLETIASRIQDRINQLHVDPDKTSGHRSRSRIFTKIPISK